jgi:NAD(P)H-hydrate epimerase
MKILSAEQIRAADRYTIAHEPIASIDLMERAASACVKWLLTFQTCQE